ncbi:hypothetical protein G6F57_021255 [Rhizopus arrhizus]|nr:hypothetical protein G6F57_021255 [Rhizopus arrhizus]
MGKNIVNVFAEPQWTVAHKGEGLPQFTVFAGEHGMQKVRAFIRSALAIAGLAALAGCATQRAPIQDEALRSTAKEAYLQSTPAAKSTWAASASSATTRNRTRRKTVKSARRTTTLRTRGPGWTCARNRGC